MIPTYSTTVLYDNSSYVTTTGFNFHIWAILDMLIKQIILINVYLNCQLWCSYVAVWLRA